MNIVSRLVASLAIAAMVVGACTAAPEGSKGPVKLVVLTHWGDQALLAVLQPIFDEYQKQNPNVKIEHQSVAFDDLLKRITNKK